MTDITFSFYLFREFFNYSVNYFSINKKFHLDYVTCYSFYFHLYKVVSIFIKRVIF
jgi:hypothetical protein